MWGTGNVRKLKKTLRKYFPFYLVRTVDHKVTSGCQTAQTTHQVEDL